MCIWHRFYVPIRKDKSFHVGTDIKWKSSEKAVSLLKKFNSLKLQLTLYKISLNLTKRAPTASHGGLSCNTGREVPKGIKKALWLEISFNLGKNAIIKKPYWKAFQNSVKAIAFSESMERYFACFYLKCMTVRVWFWERPDFCLAQQAIQLKHNV